MTPQQTIESEPERAKRSPQSFADWMQVNSRYLTIGVVVIVVAAGGVWYYLRSAELRRENAERGLMQAKQSIAAGNAALAQSDLQKVVDRYKGTPAGSEAAMVLAQMDYDQGKYEDGIKVLRPYATSSASGENLAPVLSLIGDGLTSTGKLADAADSFRQAAEATSHPGEKALYRAQQARSLAAAGKTAEAKAVWQQLVDDPDAAAVRNEATIRLGELSAQPAGRS
jgi:predicted negative regulator of RcsB-dependent stress response